MKLLEKWKLPLLMLAATTLIYLDRQALSILAPQIKADLGLDNAGFGWVLSAFYYAYTLAQFGVGLLLDRYSLRWLYGGAVVAWALVSSLTGLAGGFAALLAVRALLAVVESGNWPGAMRIVARSLPPAERSIGNGIFTSGTSVGALIAPVVIIALAEWRGWRPVFALLGAMGLAWFTVWVASTRSPALAGVWKGPPSGVPGWRAYQAALGSPQFWRVFCVTILVNPVLYFFLNWLPLYYQQQHGITPGPRMVKILTTTYLGLDLGYLGCGLIVLFLVKRGLTLRSARRVLMTAASLLLSAAALVPLTRSLEATVALVATAAFAIGLWIAMYLTLAQEVNPAAVSTTAGLLGGSGSLAGALLMGLVGKVTQMTGSFALPLYAVGAMAVLAALAGWAASRRDPATSEASTPA